MIPDDLGQMVYHWSTSMKGLVFYSPLRISGAFAVALAVARFMGSMSSEIAKVLQAVTGNKLGDEIRES